MYLLTLALALLPVDGQEPSLKIRGTITTELATEAPLRVWAAALHVNRDGSVTPISKQTIFAAATDPGEEVADERGSYVLPVQAGHYCVFAFADLDGNGQWDPQTPEPFGWYAEQASGGFDSLEIRDKDQSGVDLVLRAARPFSSVSESVAGGRLDRINGLAVLRLHGNAEVRGFAHGKLVAPQIVDFFRFYILEDKFKSAERYLNGFAKFLHSHFSYPPEFLIECNSLIQGMQASGTDMYLPELGRDFCLTDLLAINCYIETRAMQSSCTQFAAWGTQTVGTDVAGGMITGRNMDGEIDIRKVTVSHFLIFAVDLEQAGQKRYVSMMWPGFIGTLSGINEDGFYTMENAGGTGPGGVVRDLVPISWTMRQALVTLGANATTGAVQRVLDSNDNEAGGSCGPGCIILFATPFFGQRDPAFVVEGDRFGESIRTEAAVHPAIPCAIVASNHHHHYGADVDRPDTSFARRPAFSSHWRYEAGKQKLEAWHRTGRPIGTPEMRELLQTVAHGTTEYSVISRPNDLEFDVALASMRPELWDAPYRHWTTFQINELFPSRAGDSN